MACRTARSTFAVVLSAACVLGACQRDAEAPATEATAPDAPAATRVAPEAAPEAAADDAIDAIRVVDHAPVAGAGRDFDVRGFAGTFEADGTRLSLAPDGTYALAVRAEGAGAEAVGRGTWSVEADGTRIRLDPDSKDEGDRVFAIASDDALSAVDGGQVLRRDGA